MYKVVRLALLQTALTVKCYININDMSVPGAAVMEYFHNVILVLSLK